MMRPSIAGAVCIVVGCGLVVSALSLQQLDPLLLLIMKTYVSYKVNEMNMVKTYLGPKRGPISCAM